MSIAWDQRIEQIQQHALASGAIEPIATRAERIRDGDFEFAVRVAAALARKPSALTSKRGNGSADEFPPNSAADQPMRNPFLPYDPELYVCDVEPRHVCLLNKYQVVSSHLLIVTRDFQRQEGGLDAEDFEALWRCLAEREGIGFYNGGKIAGASQPHRHLQLIPFLDPRRTGFPLLEVWDSAEEVSEGIWRAPLPFPHALQRLDLPLDQPAQAGVSLQVAYRRLLRFLGRGDPVVSEPRPYNLLITRHWMFAVPRSEERAEGISLNALAFAGAMLVRDDAQLEQVRQRGPMKMLVQVSSPESADGDGHWVQSGW